MSIAAGDFEYIRRLVHEGAAIVLEPGKEYLAESRLVPVARAEGFATIAEMVARLQADPRSLLHRKVIEAMTTNETTFFRDVHPFEALRQHVIPELIASRESTKQITIWCGASSSGQEPYTIAMVLRHHFPVLASWKVRIIATDIARTMLERTREGLYSQLEVNRGLPAPMLVKWFVKEGTHWRVKPELRALVEPLELNLAGTWPQLPTCDVVFMRNVLIYFDVATKQRILERTRRCMHPDGWLFLGGAETTLNVDDRFERVPIERATTYRIKRA